MRAVLPLRRRPEHLILVTDHLHLRIRGDERIEFVDVTDGARHEAVRDFLRESMLVLLEEF